jgi:hypothetical protein
VRVIEKNEMGGACSTCGGGERRGVYKDLVGKPEKNEMGGACSTCGGGERCIKRFGGET